MTLTHYMSKWLRTRFKRSAPQRFKVLNKKERQILPTLPKQAPMSAAWQDDASPAGCRVRWHS